MNVFEKIKKGLEEAVAYERGENIDNVGIRKRSLNADEQPWEGQPKAGQSLVRKTIKYAFFVLLFLVMVILSAFVGSRIGMSIYRTRYFDNLPTHAEAISEPQNACILCKQIPTNPPCLINLCTGKISEIQLYATDPTNPKEIDTTIAEYGYAAHFGAAGASCWGFPDNHFVHISIQKETLLQYSAEHAQQYFCDNCMSRINEVEPDCCYLFADCYDKDDVALYKLGDAKSGIQIRHYTIEITEMNDMNLYLDMKSSFFDEPMSNALKVRNDGLPPV